MFDNGREDIWSFIEFGNRLVSTIEALGILQ